jgi:hypothetical protein
MKDEDKTLSLNQGAEHYLGLESMEVTEILLDMCGPTLDKRALPLLRRRLDEEQAHRLTLQSHGYIRMSEKSEQLVASLKPLITLLEQPQEDRQENQR